MSTASRATSRAATAGLVAAAALIAAACGSTTAPATARSAAVAAVPASPLGTSIATPAATWATVVMGGSAAQYNNFWQLFVRLAGSPRWELVTPPGTADNGGLVLAPDSESGLITAFRPSQLLTYTPLSQTGDAGRAWSSINPLDAALASTPSAIAVDPGSNRLTALTASGSADEAAVGSQAWHTLATTRAVAATQAGRACGLTALTAVAWTPAGAPLLAGSCTRAGKTGIFVQQNGAWQAAAPALPASLAGQDISVSRLAVDGSQTVALLTVGTGKAARIVAAWSDDGRSGDDRSGDDSARWTLSPPLELDGSEPASASFGPGGQVAIITAAGHGALMAGTGGSWRTLPALPPGTATLAPGSSGQADALAVHAGTLTVWQLSPGGTTWTQAQVMKVPIQYGSSS
jgi:hypothetical protein